MDLASGVTIAIVKIGEIYFIRERDRIDGGSSSYVKIGMVKDISRNSEERLLDHQTGNPRDLELHHVTQTPGPFRVERFLHQQFGPRRVRSEWFQLSDEELSLAVQAAERLAREAFVHVPIMEAAGELGSVISSSEKITPTEESTEWIRILGNAKEALKLCRELADTYKTVATDLPTEVRAEVELEELIVTEHYLEKKFDAEGFDAAYPGLLGQYTEVSVSVNGRFTPTFPAIDLAEFDRELMEFRTEFLDACDQVRRGTLAFGELFDIWQILERYMGSYSWDADVADAHLRVICGASAGIEGQVTWNRTAKEKKSLESDRLESDHPEKYNKFVTVNTLTRLKTQRRARRTV